MRKLGIALVFLVGCAAGGATGQLVVPKAKAANGQRWEHFCMRVQAPGRPLEPDDYNAQTKNPGAEGWELTTQDGSLLCFKRPL